MAANGATGSVMAAADTNEPRAVRSIETLLQRGNISAAREMALQASSQWPRSVSIKVLLGHALSRDGQTQAALDAADAAMALDAHDPAPRMLRVEALLQAGRNGEALAELRGLQARPDIRHPRLLQDIAQRLTVLGQHVEAESCHARARALQPADPGAIYNHATSLIALGRLAEAEAALDKVIALKPNDSDAWYNRATLRKQTSGRNHVLAIEQSLQRPDDGRINKVPLYFALAKEQEDLGCHDASFAALKQGAELRRKHLSYRVEDDIETMRLIGAAFDAHQLAAAAPGHADPRPLFIVGLPRSGTTLVDRILGSHSAVVSRGETTDLAMSVVREAGAARSKAELVELSSKLDPAALGRRYCNHLPDASSDRQIDKTPANFLYLGLVAAALPQARIIHVRRQPMDVCYAMYKTLFRMAYPFSYSLDDLGRYWLAWNTLMTHWRRVLPAERYLEIDYEDLIEQQEPVTRRLIAYAGLPWEDACMTFERNRQPSLTASAAQVRQPIYRSSIGLWTNHRQQLAPLRALLESAGIDVDSDDKERSA